MCRLVINAMKQGNKRVIENVKRLAGNSLPKTPRELCRRLLHTVYMGMSKQSSIETRKRARNLADAIGSYHINLDIDSVFEAQKSLVANTLNFEASFKVDGGTDAENLLLQNIQART